MYVFLCKVTYLHRRGPLSGPLFIDTHGQPLTRFHLSSFIQCLTGSGNPWAFFQATAFALGLPPQPCNAAFQITLSRPWAGGPVMLINSTLEPQWNQFWKFLEATSVTGTLPRKVAYSYSAAQIYPNQNIRVIRVSPMRAYAYAYTQIHVYSVCAYASLVCMS